MVAVAAGGVHSLALRADGTVAAWGDNEYGQTTVPAWLSNVVAVAAGVVHSLALRADGTVATWGNDGGGMTTTVPVDLSNVVAIAGGQFYSLALRANGTVVAWGGNYYEAPTGLRNVVAIAAGGFHSLAVIGVGAPVVAPMVDHLEVAAGLPFFLRIETSGEWPMYFQWQRNGTPVAGATGAVLQTTAVNLDVAEYRCVVSNALGVTTGNIIRVFMAPLLMVTPPVGGTSCLGEPWVFSAKISGVDPANYQWLKDGAPSRWRHEFAVCGVRLPPC